MSSSHGNRNALRYPSAVSLDIGLSKRFTIREQLNFTLRASKKGHKIRDKRANGLAAGRTQRVSSEWVKEQSSATR